MNQTTRDVTAAIGDVNFAVSVLQLALAELSAPVAAIVAERAARRDVVTVESIRAASVLRRLTDLDTVLKEFRNDADFWRRYNRVVLDSPLFPESPVVASDNVVQSEPPEAA